MLKIVVVDGLDGSGKATQAKILKSYLEQIGKYKVYQISFPDYDSESSTAVKMYLNGELGQNPEEINPYMCSTFYAVDRAIQYTKKIRHIEDEDDAILICDRYLSANLIHQGAKIKDEKERHRFYKWCYDFENNLLKIPKEAVTIVLSVPVEISQELLDTRYKGDESRKDIHEKDVKYLKDCYFSANDAYEYLSKEGFNWKLIHCETPDKQKIRQIGDIHQEIVEILKEMDIIE